MTKVSNDLYGEEVRKYAEMLSQRVEDDDEHDDPERAAFELARGVVDGHPWFTSPDPAMHGEIVAHSDADPESTVDLDAYIEGKGPENVLRAVAFLCFEADVINSAEV